LTPGSIELEGTIVAGNAGGDNCGSPLADGGNNFADDGSCGADFDLIAPGVDFDITLADNGGPTGTHALLAGSVAIDAAGDCGLPVDQRGLPRADGACDSGAFEFGATAGDADDDGVPDEDDVCPDTMIPESVPLLSLGSNRWALVDADFVFDTNPSTEDEGSTIAFTVDDTRGCSCEQIIEAWALGLGHAKFGCSGGAMLQWIATVWGYELSEPEPESGTEAGGLQPLESDAGDSAASSTNGTSDPEPSRPARRSHRPTPRRNGSGD
jgi:hypothetical protein